MKNLITILILFAFGCGKSLKEEDVVGSYEWDILEFVLLENGKFEAWTDGEKDGEATWVIVGKEVHVGSEKERAVFKVEPNGDLTCIAHIGDGRKDFATKDFKSFKKVK